MIEGRAIIKNIAETRNKLGSIGATFDNSYSFRDIIYIPTKEVFNLDADFIRVRCYIKNNWESKPVVLIRKQTEFKDIGKIDKIILRKEFDSAEEAYTFITDELGSDFKIGFEYTREGWEYSLEGKRIFVEDIKGWSPSIECESESEEELASFFNQLETGELIKTSVAQIMRNILTNNSAKKN